MQQKLSGLLVVILLPISVFSQKIKPERLGRLPSGIIESSGLCVADSTLLWTMNDSGGNNELYCLDHHGRLVSVFSILNTINHDWEDLTTDKNANIYIGDFGNNNNQRKSLVIYKVHLNSTKDSINTSVISFHYSDQQEFPPLPSNWNFDVEAFFHAGDSLYLFSKNTANPSDGYTKLYRLQDAPGNYTAQLIDSFCLHEPVTGAGISPDGKTVVLLTYFSIWVLKDFPNTNFFGGKVYCFPLKGFTQKEAICFQNNQRLFISDERHFGKGGKLYCIDWSQLDFSKPPGRYKSPFLKRIIYNAFNNPKANYKRIMRKEAVQ